MKKITTSLSCAALVFALAFAGPACSEEPAPAADLKAGEKAVLEEMKSFIPKDKFKTVDDLYAKWQEIQEGKSKAIIVDIRRESEFDAGHIIDSNNIAAGRALAMPQLVSDPDAEIWVTCRTQHRAVYFAGMLYKYGYKNVHVVNGGIEAWAEKGYPFASKYLGKVKVLEYHKEMKENYLFREERP